MTELIGLAKAGLDLATSALGLKAAAAAGGLNLIGITPVLGPGRAIGLAFYSWFRSELSAASVRRDEIEDLRKWLSSKTSNPQGYRVVTGEKGVGKSCMIENAMYRRGGVVYASVSPGDSEEKIRDNVLKAIGKRTPYSFGDPIASARRTIACYRFMFRRSPVAVISATERSAGDHQAKLTGAVRALTDMYKLRVIVDASPNSLDPTIFYTERASVMRLERLSKEQTFSIPEIREMFESTKMASWADVAWKVIGGNPSIFKQMRDFIFLKGKPEDRVAEFLGSLLFSAIELINASVEANPHTAEIIDKLRVSKNRLEWKDKGTLKLSSPDKVFRIVESSGKVVIVPASNALDIVIRLNLAQKPSAQELRDLD